MQPEFLTRLSEPVQQFVFELEKATGINIDVAYDSKQNMDGSTGLGKLAIEVDAKNIRLFAPTTGYFPDGAVRHELLHVQRFHIQGVPKLALADDEDWDENFSSALGAIDNAIEHVFIVPVELQLHPERYEHWEAIMCQVCSDLSNIPEGERPLAACLHWTFLRLVLPNSPQTEILKDFALQHGLLDMANLFIAQFQSVANSKEEIVRLIFSTFSDVLPRRRTALEYINSLTGTHQKPIP